LLGFADTSVKYFRDRNEKIPCTTCRLNPLCKIVSEEKDSFSDHIFVSENSNVCIKESGRFATEAEVKVNNPVQYCNVTAVPLSDHYGVYTTLCISTSPIGSTAQHTPYPPPAEPNYTAAWGSFGIALVIAAVL
jgi:hypothetical protein